MNYYAGLETPSLTNGGIFLALRCIKYTPLVLLMFFFVTIKIHNYHWDTNIVMRN